jgi:hypothetical protein
MQRTSFAVAGDDCDSVEAMRRQGIIDALTNDLFGQDGSLVVPRPLGLTHLLSQPHPQYRPLANAAIRPACLLTPPPAFSCDGHFCGRAARRSLSFPVRLDRMSTGRTATRNYGIRFGGASRFAAEWERPWRVRRALS